MSSPQVKVEAHQNEYLPAEGRTVDAVITVATSGIQAGPVKDRGDVAEIIMIDVSTSMAGENLRAAKAAAAGAIDALRDGVAFGIVAGNDHAWALYPKSGSLAVASVRTRWAAQAAVKTLSSSGGTAIGTWLSLANRMFERRGAAINHGILLTDGANGESADQFNQVLHECTGRFVCDSRGVGSGWVARDLIKIAETLLGTASGIQDPRNLKAEFVAMTEAAMGKTMAEVMLRVWTPTGARIQFLKQVHPEITDLTNRRTAKSERIGEYPIGAWGAETREYHLRVDVEPNPVGAEMLAARVSVVHGDDALAQCLVRAVWTDDLAASTTMNRQVAHYTNETEMAEAIQAGISARAAGDEPEATAQLGLAVRLAHEAGREDTAKMLAKVVDVVDERTGTVRLRRQAANIDAEMAAVGSRKTQRVRPDQPR